MTLDRQATGVRGEQLAARLLEEKGFSILERRWRCRHGEIDLVAQDGETLVFVEVKARKSRRYGRAVEAVTPRKQQRLVGLAAAYLKATGRGRVSCRFDVVAIEQGDKGPQLRHIPNAFGQDGSYTI